MNEEPIYSQVEIDAMLACEKWACTVDWDRSEESWPQVRSTPGERATRFEAFPYDESSGMGFSIVLRHNAVIGALSITLQGRVFPDAPQAICRYDIHGNPHPNES